MTWAGFLIAVATAAIGGAASLLISGKHLMFTLIAIGFATWIFVAAWITVDSIRPKKYSFPGNMPENWLAKTGCVIQQDPMTSKKLRLSKLSA